MTTNLSARNKRNKDKGAEFEIDLEEWFRELGLKAQRLPKTGREDEGDVEVTFNGDLYVVEAKNEGKIDLSGYLRELDREVEFYAKHRGIDAVSVNGIVVIKRRRSSIGKSYVVSTLEAYFDGRVN